MSTLCLQVNRLTKRFADVVAVKDVSFEIGEGETLGLFGPNGSGKTTIINLISGVYRPDAGSIQLWGVEMVGLKPHQVAARGVARTFQLARPFLNMTVYENVLVARLARGGGLPRPEARVNDLLGFTGLLKQKDWPASRLSSGCLRRLEIARALATEPRLILVDEPLAGLSLKEEGIVRSLLREVQAAGVTMLVVSHRPDLLAELAGKVLILCRGQVVREGPPAEVLPRAVEEVMHGRSP